MFKKIILLLVVLFPFWYSLVIGYPVISNKEYGLRIKQIPNVSVSKRCFGIGDFKQLLTCYSYEKRLQGIGFINTITQKTNQISPVFTVLLSISLVLFILLSIIVLVK